MIFLSCVLFFESLDICFVLLYCLMVCLFWMCESLNNVWFVFILSCCCCFLFLDSDNFIFCEIKFCLVCSVFNVWVCVVLRDVIIWLCIVLRDLSLLWCVMFFDFEVWFYFVNDKWCLCFMFLIFVFSVLIVIWLFLIFFWYVFNCFVNFNCDILIVCEWLVIKVLSFVVCLLCKWLSVKVLEVNDFLLWGKDVEDGIGYDCFVFLIIKMLCFF